MTMASRDIANMHLFLDLKKKFPDLPDDTLRNYVSLYGEDQDKCINLLQKESENHYHPSQPFADFRFPESKSNSRKSDNMKSCGPNESVYSAVYQVTDMPASYSKIQMPSGRSSSHVGVVHLPGMLLNPNMPFRPESYSAPVMATSEKPFNKLYKQSPVSSHTTLCQIPSDKDSYNQMMFSTTKEHIIPPPVSHESTAYLPIYAESELSKKHAVKLSITPSFPFQQQNVNVYSNPVCATASHSSRPGRHTTSLNFQLQPQSSNQYPLEISTIPTNLGNPCNSKDFGSHVQISVGSQGATFTALRVQRPSYSQSQNLSTHEEYVPSSQAQNSSLYRFPNRRIQPLPSSGTGKSFQYPQDHDAFQKGQESYAANTNWDSIQNYQSSPDYILAVKNHQIAQLDLILSELDKEKFHCSQLKTEVNKMEQDMAQRNASKASSLYTEELNKIRDENRRLRIECNCLLMEVDMFSTGQIPLGVTDEDFYSNIFTGPHGAIASSKAPTSVHIDEQEIRPDNETFEEDDDERNRWKCKKCTFANHPALEKCEMCEMPKSSEFVDCNSNYPPSTCLRFVSSPKSEPQRAIGSVQISVTRRVPSSSKSVKFHYTHRLPR